MTVPVFPPRRGGIFGRRSVTGRRGSAGITWVRWVRLGSTEVSGFSGSVRVYQSGGGAVSERPAAKESSAEAAGGGAIT